MSDIERVYKEQHTIKPFISLFFRNIIFLNMKKHWDDFFFSSSCSSLFHSQEDEKKNHIFISKKKRHIKTDTYWKWLWWHQGLFWGTREKSSEDEEGSEWERDGKKKIDSDERRSYLNLEGKKIEKRIFCVGLFIYFSSFSFFFRPLCLIYIRIKWSALDWVFFIMWYQTI